MPRKRTIQELEREAAELFSQLAAQPLLTGGYRCTLCGRTFATLEDAVSFTAHDAECLWRRTAEDWPQVAALCYLLAARKE